MLPSTNVGNVEGTNIQLAPVHPQRRKRFTIDTVIHYWIAVVLVAGMAFPLCWMLYSSLKTNREIFASPFALPQRMRLGHFVEAWQVGNLGRFYLNSIFVTLTSVVIIVTVSSLAAYAFARFTFKGRDVLYYTFLIGLMLPPQVVIIPLYILLRDLNMLNTYWSLILPYSAWSLSVSIFLLRSFYLTLPGELEDAAKIDGASLFQTFRLVMLPLIRPALVTVVVLNIVNLWNEFLFALLFIQDEARRTLPAGMLNFYGYHQVDYRLVFSGLSIVTIPILIAFFFFQKQVINGLTISGVER
ncbi:MAG: carbohydrate ABC transporter permease [Deinococcota bacterium]